MTLLRRTLIVASTTLALAPATAHARGTTVRVNCRLRGAEVRGNDVWYNLPQGLWVSARYVADVGSTPGWCTA